MISELPGGSSDEGNQPAKREAQMDWDDPGEGSQPAPVFLPRKSTGQRSLMETIHRIHEGERWLSYWTHTEMVKGSRKVLILGVFITWLCAILISQQIFWTWFFFFFLCRHFYRFFGSPPPFLDVSYPEIPSHFTFFFSSLFLFSITVFYPKIHLKYFIWNLLYLHQCGWWVRVWSFF